MNFEIKIFLIFILRSLGCVIYELEFLKLAFPLRDHIALEIDLQLVNHDDTRIYNGYSVKSLPAISNSLFEPYLREYAFI